jgi:hemerythrin-like metal-binding protein
MKNWSDIFSMGIDELDQDHKRLLRVAEMIAERVDNPDTDPKQWPFLVREGLRYMGGYYETHVEREEAFMQQNKYPHYEVHKQVHDELKRTVQQYIDTQIEGADCKIESVLELLGATYGWQMVHIAMDDMAIVGRGTMAKPSEEELNAETELREIDWMLEDLLNCHPRTKVVDAQYKGGGMSDVVSQKMHYDVAGTDVTLIIGMEPAFLRHITETFWGDKKIDKTLDKAHTMLLQWCLTAFCVGFWRNMIGRFDHDKPCVLKEVVPMDKWDARQLMRGMEPRQSTLYETTRGRFFVLSDH